MRKVKITTVLTVTEGFYQEEIVDMKNDILSGKMQRELQDEGKRKGVKKVKVTFEEIL